MCMYDVCICVSCMDMYVYYVCMYDVCICVSCMDMYVYYVCMYGYVCVLCVYV